MSGVWLVWSNEHGAWWAPAGMGYTTVLSEAGRYTWEEAGRIVQRAAVGGPVTRHDRLSRPIGVPPEVAVLVHTTVEVSGQPADGGPS